MSGPKALDFQYHRWYYCKMPVAKVAISLEPRLLRRVDALVKTRVFRSRSEVVGQALTEKLARMEGTRLARECAKLSVAEEQALADAGLAADLAAWPEY